MIALYLIGIIAGIASTFQVSINGRIREIYRTPYAAAVMNFVFAGAVLALIVVIRNGEFSIPLADIAEYPPWIWLGGACGTAIITLNVICLPKLGSGLNIMLLCFGQVMAGLVIDHFGLFGTSVIPMTFTRTIGAFIVIAGIALVSGIGRQKGAESVLLYALLAVINGFACATQIATNGTLSTVTDSAEKAAFISMTVGLITTAALIILILAVRGREGVFECEPEQPLLRIFRPWMCLGAMMGVIIIGGNALIAPAIGTGISTVMNLIGMIGTGLVLDAVGFLGIEKKPVTVNRILGMILMTAGTAVISLL